MSSTRRQDADQAVLPFEVALRTAEPVVQVAVRSVVEEATRGRHETVLRHRLDVPACGWPVGTEAVVERDRRPRRGDVVLVREAGRSFVGPYEVRFGRPFLRSAGGAIWLGPGVEVVGVVVAVDASLALR